MKITIIASTLCYSSSSLCFFLTNSDFPAGLAYIAGALKSAGHTVTGINANNDRSFKTSKEMAQYQITRGIEAYKPKLIALGGLCIDFNFLKDAIELIREIAPLTPIVLGGGIVTHDAKFIFETLKPDFCVIGEGEETIIKLADMLDSKCHSFEKIQNIGFWKEGKAFFTTECNQYIDINKLAYPDYSVFGLDEMMDKFHHAARYQYRYPRLNPKIMTIVAARSCPFKCSFCIHRSSSNYRARSIDNIIDEITFFYNERKFNILIILDELFAIDKKRLKDFCDRILQGKEKYGWDFNWSFQTHASASLDKKTLKMAKDAGCYFFSYGIESASEKVLKSMNKKTTPNQLSKAIQIANEVEIGFGGNLIFGDPVETPETISETLSFYRKYCTESHILFADLKPYPGSELFDYCIKTGIISDKLEYYKNIDRVDINMTSMTDLDWAHWLRRVIPTLSTYFLVKCVNAKKAIRRKEWSENPLSDNGKKSLWEVSTQCPYCGKEYTYQEWVDDEYVLRKGYRFLTGCSHCNKCVNVNLPVVRGKGLQINISDI